MAELEALSKLKKAGRLRFWRGTVEIDECELHAICDEIQAEHEQAIAATLRTSNDIAKALIDDMLDFIGNCCETTIDCGCCDPVDCKYLDSDGELAECTRYQDFLSRAKAISATLREFNLDGLSNGLTVSEDGILLNGRSENYVKQGALGNGTLTVEQVRDLIERHSLDYYGMRQFLSSSYAAIADELNAELEFVKDGV